MTVATLSYRLLHAIAGVAGIGRLISRTFRPVVVTEILPDGVVAEGEFYGPSVAITSRVQEFGHPFVPPDEEPFPPVGWRVVDDATVMNTRHFPYLVHGHHMMVGARRNPGPWQVVRKGNQVVWQDGYRALVNMTRGDTLEVDHALFLGGHDFTNWYHWLVDALPQLHLARLLPEPYRGWPVLVPEQIFRYPTMVDALNLFLDGRGVIRVPEWSRVRGSLCWIDALEITNVPESQVNSGPGSHIHLLHREGMESYRRVFIDRYAGESSPYGKKVFLTRSGSRRSYNQDQIIAVARGLGFEPVAPDSLSVAEQVQLFHHATHLIGPSGAGFAGLLFSSPDTKVLCWQDSRLQAMTILPDLATLANSHYWHVFYTPESGGIFTADYHLDPGTIREQLDAFTQSPA